MLRTVSDLTYIGEDLERPESVLVTASGDIFVSDYTCGVVKIGGPRRALIDAPRDFLPNGIALRQSGDFLIASLNDAGGLAR